MLSKRFTNVHLTADTDVSESDLRWRICCQSLGSGFAWIDDVDFFNAESVCVSNYRSDVPDVIRIFDNGY